MLPLNEIKHDIKNEYPHTEYWEKWYKYDTTIAIYPHDQVVIFHLIDVKGNCHSILRVPYADFMGMTYKELVKGLGAAIYYGSEPYSY